MVAERFGRINRAHICKSDPMKRKEIYSFGARSTEYSAAPDAMVRWHISDDLAEVVRVHFLGPSRHSHRPQYPSLVADTRHSVAE